ncbi:MAG TPA: gliding motility-associated C-terminal domain-containing protein [Bacteroidales bacterium]|nr:gliding motility-associated C-terminal domain-containing protein [Bacteroidales bacterium]HQB74390.1 gliding motility-associated C-terminal domain-containing protein [Bacteroidales bacterium]
MSYHLAIQMKKLALFLSILFSLLCINGQVVTIGSGNSTNTSIPSVLSQNYSYSQQIYTATEVGDAAPICGISLWKTSTETIYRYVTIYLGHTQQTQFTSNTNWIPIGELTLVFSGIVKFLPNTWSYIGFDTPFQYDGADGNLVVAFDDNTQIKEATQTFKVFSTPNGTIHNSSDVNNPNPSSPAAGTRLNVRNQIKIHKCAPTLMSNTSINTCDLLYSDPGGMDDYSPNQIFTQVITSSTPNNRLEVHFLEFDLANGDTLWIYNGNGTNAPLIGIFGAFVSPFNFTSSGSSLTFKFKSDNSVESAGWLAQILCRSCTPVSISTGSPCQPDPNSITGYAAKPFCTDENPYGIEYPSGTSGNTNSYISAPACLWSTPAPAWYFMRISDPGDILIFISQTSSYGSGLDVDFACWGPFYADNQQDFMQRWCCGEYILHNGYVPSHRPPNGDHTNDMGGYPVSNLIDCSYRADATEWAFIPNAQTGQYYILLITNYSQQAGTILFNTVPQFTTGSTDCSLLASVTSNGQICEGETIHLYSNNNQPNITHSWNGPNGFTSTLTNPVITNATPANSGTYYLTITNQAGNNATDSTQVIVHPTPSVTLSSTALNICVGDSVTLTAEGANSYSWSHNLGPGSQHTTTPPDSITYIVIGNNYGCTDTASVTIAVNQVPQVQIQEPIGNLCPNIGTMTISSTSSGGTPEYTYSWTGSGIVNQNSNTTLFNPDSSQCNSEYPILLEITDQNLCKGRDSITIEVSDVTNPQFTTLPFPFQYAVGTYPNYTMPDLNNLVTNNIGDNCWNTNQLTVSQSIAAGSIINENSYVQITVTDPCNNSCTALIRIITPLYIQMTDSNQVSCFGGNDGSATVTVHGGIPPYQYFWNNSTSSGGAVNSSLEAGTYQVTVTDSLGISLNCSITITQPDSLLSANYLTTDAYCEQNNGTFEVTPLGGTPPYQYNWSQGGNNAEILDLEAGVYSCTITDAHGCTTSLSDTIHKLNPVQIIDVNSHRETCNQQNGSIEITLSEGTPPYYYLWNNASGSFGSEITQLAGDYYFITVTDQYGCTDTTSIDVGSVDFSASVLETTPSYCDQDNGSVTLSLTGDVENPHIDWGPILHHDELYADHLPGGIYTVSVEDYGCVDTVTFEIEEIPNPIACFDFSPDGMLTTEQLVSFYNCSSNGENYEWNFGDGHNSTMINPQHQYFNAGNYNVTLFTSNQYDCIDSTSTLIVVIDKVMVYLPNSFTPNQDGVNDVFIPIFSSVSEIGYQFTVFNRWGEVIFQTTNPSKGWDGTHQNKTVPAGIYSYLLLFQNENGKEFKRSGSIRLIR